ncbi:FeoB-associated Cys-rich membrane protein [Proteiniclasticum sp.]|uniref:FeoB-associated Cys-rich membrane protein n=1 Tax=Proteiniclasticum sp. TaxID=2053595 RepID=UPI0028993BBB|nr:FeoB-associated Cys-rich membrane protein [Proteiniclasticum sp.]
MEIVITIAIVAAAVYFLVKKIKATKAADCTTCSACSTDCSVYTPERAMGIEFISKQGKNTDLHNN